MVVNLYLLLTSSNLEIEFVVIWVLVIQSLTKYVNKCSENQSKAVDAKRKWGKGGAQRIVFKRSWRDMVKKYLTRENSLITDNYMFQICFLSASLGLTDDQREFQRVALEFAKNELAPEMQKWDQEVCEKKGF